MLVVGRLVPRDRTHHGYCQAMARVLSVAPQIRFRDRTTSIMPARRSIAVYGAGYVFCQGGTTTILARMPADTKKAA